MLILVGFVNIPIIKFSVEWWNTLHQPASVIRMSGSAIDAEFLWPLLTMAIGLHAAVLHITHRRHAQRNLAPARGRTTAACRPHGQPGGLRHMTHAFYIGMSYAATGLVVLCLIAWVVVDGQHASVN